jgi:DNA-binding response OmpR family regulator
MFSSTSCFHLLLLDGSPRRRHALAAALRMRGFAATECETAEATLGLLEAAEGRLPADLLLLRTDGAARHRLHLLGRVRAASSVPVVVIGTALDSNADRVAALELGADDYFGPTMPVAEVVARIRAVLRRAGSNAVAPRPAEAPATPWRAIEGGWRLLPHRRALESPAGATVPLTGAEFELMRLLSAALGEPVDRETISRSVFRRPWQAEDRAVDGLVKRLRRKLAADAIASVRGIGYALRFAEIVPGEQAASLQASKGCSGHAQVEICVRDLGVSNPKIQSAVAK